MHFQNKILHQRNYIWHPIVNKLYSLNCWYYSVVYRNPVLNWWFSFPFQKKKKKKPCSYRTPLSHQTSFTPTKSDVYLSYSLSAAASEPAPCRLLIFQISNLMSRFNCIGRIEVSVQVRGFQYEYFVTKYFFFFGGELLALRPTPKLEVHHFRLSATPYSIYLQLPSIMEADPPSAT